MNIISTVQIELFFRILRGLDKHSHFTLEVKTSQAILFLFELHLRKRIIEYDVLVAQNFFFLIYFPCIFGRIDNKEDSKIDFPCLFGS